MELGISATGKGIAFAGAIASGATLTYIIGGVTMLAGAGSLTFMSSEIQEASGNGNWMIDAGMSEGLYNGLLIGTAIVATLGTCASSIAHSFNINSIQKVGNLQGTQYKGIRFTQKTRSGGMRVRTLEYHTHFHRGYKPHWQLNKWDGFIRRGVEGRWSWWLKRI